MRLAALILLAALPSAALAGDGGAVATIRVLTHNIYGRREADCESRYKALAARILSASPPYDVVALQEHWRVPFDHWISCDADVLTRALEADGRYKGAGRSVKHKPGVDGPFQVAGGDSVFTLHSITDERDGYWTNGKRVPLSGYVLARVAVAPGVTLDLWDAHLEAASDGCSDDCRRKQAAELGAALEKNKSGDPALVVGDFNTGGPMTRTEKPPFAGNGGYGDVLGSLRSPRDLWLELGSGSGFTTECDPTRAGACAGTERIDYMLLPEDERVLDPRSTYVLVPKSVDVVRWTTADGKPVSDHLGLDGTFEIRRRAPIGNGLSFTLSEARVVKW